jgi:hypothetical protein
MVGQTQTILLKGLHKMVHEKKGISTDSILYPWAEKSEYNDNILPEILHFVIFIMFNAKWIIQNANH